MKCSTAKHDSQIEDYSSIWSL